MSIWYVLRGRTPVACADPLQWAQELEWMHRHIGDDTIGGIRISTIFTAIDHGFPGGPPLLFETMTFGASFGPVQLRCSTYMQAEEMHAAVVDLVRDSQERAVELTADMIRRVKEKP